MTDIAIALGIFAVVAAIMYYGNASMTRRHNAWTPNKAYFVGNAELLATSAGDRAIVGKILINAVGIEFEKSPPATHIRGLMKPPQPMRLLFPWEEVNGIKVEPVQDKPLPGFLYVEMKDGSLVDFRVTLYRRLLKALDGAGLLARFDAIDPLK